MTDTSQRIVILIFATYLLLTLTHMRKIKIKRQFIIQWRNKQTDRQADGHDMTDFITFLDNAVSNKQSSTGLNSVRLPTTYNSDNYRERKCADTTGTVLVPGLAISNDKI